MASFSLIAFCAFLIISFVYGQPGGGGGDRDKYEVFKEEWCGDYNCYQVLDVTPDVDFREIKQRYNNLSLTLHPDKNPNATDAEKERYVRINKAYEILSSKRREYDDYLRIKSSMDSPVESPILVLILLYLGIAYVVLYYQRQQQQQCKDAILKNAQVVRYYWENKKIDLTGKKKVSGKGKGKGKKKNNKMTAQDLEEIKKAIDIDELNDIISRLNLVVPGYKDVEPTYQQACIDVFSSMVSVFSEIASQLRWMIKYKLLKQDYSEEDQEILCRKYHKKTEQEWLLIPQEDREKLLNKSGPWRNKSDQEKDDKKRRKKRN